MGFLLFPSHFNPFEAVTESNNDDKSMWCHKVKYVPGKCSVRLKKKKVGVDFVLFSTTLQHSAAIFGQLGGFQKTLVSSLSIVSRHCPFHPPSVHVFIKAF